MTLDDLRHADHTLELLQTFRKVKERLDACAAKELNDVTLHYGPNPGAETISLPIDYFSPDFFADVEKAAVAEVDAQIETQLLVLAELGVEAEG